MLEFLNTTPVQAVIWTTVLAVLVTVGVYVVSRVRGGGEYEAPSSNDLLTNFRDLHDEGGLHPVEYKKIKAVLGDQLQDELKDEDEQD